MLQPRRKRDVAVLALFAIFVLDFVNGKLRMFVKYQSLRTYKAGQAVFIWHNHLFEFSLFHNSGGELSGIR